MNNNYRWSAAIRVVLLAFGIRLVLLCLSRQNPLELVEPIQIAISLAEGRGFANAYGGDSGPSAHTSPLYPLLMSPIFFLFSPDSLATANLQRMFGYLLTSMGAGAIVICSGIFSLPPAVGLAAGLVTALVPVNSYAERGNFESPLTALGCWALLIAFYKTRNETAPSAVSGWKLGTLMGALTLISPNLGLCGLGLCLWQGIRLGRSWWPKLAVVLSVMVLIQVPWLVRNRIVLNAWILTRSNLGLELLVSNNDDAKPVLEDNINPGGTHSREHPYANPQQREKLKSMGEVKFHSEKMERAKLWIETHPERFIKLSLLRILYSWIPKLKRPVQGWYLGSIALLGFAGLLLAWRNGEVWAAYPAIILFFYPLPYYIVETSSRYRFPVEGLLMMLAAYTVHHAVEVVRATLSLLPSEPAKAHLPGHIPTL